MWLLRSVVTEQFKDKGLENGKTYTYAISALNKVGEGPSSDEVAATPGRAPGAPANVEVTVQDGEVTVTWDPPADNGGFEVTGYKVYRGTSSSDMTEVGAVDGTTFSDSDVDKGTEYYYKVSAVNDLGEGDASKVISIMVPKDKVENNSPLGALNPMWLILVIVVVVSVVAVTVFMRSRGKGGDPSPPQQPAPEPPAPAPPVTEAQQPYQEQQYYQPEQPQDQYQYQYQTDQYYQQPYDQSAGQWDQSQGWDQGQQYYDYQQPPQQY
jgi:predicted RNA-binding protein with TRAM domain